MVSLVVCTKGPLYKKSVNTSLHPSTSLGQQRTDIVEKTKHFSAASRLLYYVQCSLTKEYAWHIQVAQGDEYVGFNRSRAMVYFLWWFDTTYHL